MTQSIKICETNDLIKNSGICALLNADAKDNEAQQQVALYYLPDSEQKVFALSNWDPFGKANVMSRGMLGNLGDSLVVASPLYKQHFDLQSGVCIEDPEQSLKSYQVEIRDEGVFIQA